MNSGELLKGEDQGVDHPLFPPESQLERGIVLDEGADSCGDDLATRGLLFWAGLVAAQGFGSFDDRQQRHFKPEILQPLPDGGVVERGDRQAGIFDHRPLFQDAFSDQALSLSL